MRPLFPLRASGPAPRTLWALLILTMVATAAVSAEEPDRGFFGITPRFTEEGVTIVKITPGGPAEQVGILPGDRIVLLDGKPLEASSDSDLFEIFTGFAVGDVIEVTVERDEELHRMEVALVPVPEPTREEQDRIDAIEQRARAGEIVGEILASAEVLELRYSPEGALLLRESSEGEWRPLEPLVAQTFEPVAKQFLGSGDRTIVRLRIERDEEGGITLVPVN